MSILDKTVLGGFVNPIRVAERGLLTNTRFTIRGPYVVIVLRYLIIETAFMFSVRLRAF